MPVFPSTPNTLRLSLSASLLFLLALLTATVTAAAERPIPGLTANILYTTDSTGAYHADLYQPSTPGPHPAVLAIHGGSWRSGHKSELRRLCTDLADRGYACFSIDYDTHPHSFPLSWQEARAALRYLHTHAAELGIDPARIAVLGTSAGGQLAALLALAPQGPANTPSPPEDLPVAAGILFNGIYDLHVSAYVVHRYLGGSCDQIPTVWNEASPDSHVQSNAPPLFVGHGTHDHLVPYAQATTLIGALHAAHDPVTPFVATGAGHSYWRSRRWYTANLDAVTSFLSRSL